MTAPVFRSKLDSMLEAFLQEEPSRALNFQRSFDSIQEKLGNLDKNIERNYLELKGDVRGLQARVAKLEDTDRKQIVVPPPLGSLPPVKGIGTTSGTGNHVIITVEEAQERDLAMKRLIAQHERDLAAGRWGSLMSGFRGIVLLVVGAVVLAGLGLLGGALLQQAVQHPPTLETPHVH